MTKSPATSDPYRLRRFVDAQAGTFELARAELADGCKRGHWMWFMFPQLRGLGHSHTAIEFGISGRAEAAAYLSDAVLGPRLVALTRLVTAIEGRSARDIFGTPDDLKFRSCMTLFAAVADDAQVFQAALDRFCGGQSDPATLALLEPASGG